MIQPEPPTLPDRHGGRVDREGRFIHATAIAIRHHALLILGPSRSGKSRLALALIAASRPLRPIVLIGDDRILLSTRADRLVARPHPRIAGFIERRGLGIVASPFRERAPVGALVVLGGSGMARETCRDNNAQNLPCLPIVQAHDARSSCAEVLRWWTSLPGMTGKA